jgi:PKD repeat protein
MNSIITRYFMVPAVVLLLSLAGCGSDGGGGTASTASSAPDGLTAEDIATTRAIEDSVASFDAGSALPGTTLTATPPVAGEQKVFGKKQFVVPKSGTLNVTKTFTGLVDGAQGTLVFYNSFGKDIPTAPCTGTAKQIKVCEKTRAIALALNPTSVEVILNGQTVIAPNQIPRTQGKALIPVTVNLADTLQVNLSGPKHSFIQLEVWSMPTAPVVLNPVADFSFSPTTGGIPLMVTFDASASSSPNGSILAYSWDFGDGSRAEDKIPQVTHIYNTAGTFNVVLTVIDMAKQTATKTAQITTSPAITLTFDEIPDGAGLTNQYQNVGVTASGVQILNSIGLPWPANTPLNVAFAPTGLMTFTLDPLIIGNVQMVSAYISGDTSVGIYAYDANGILVGQASAPAGANNVLVTVTSSGAPITSVQIHDGGATFIIDTLKFIVGL